MDGSGRSKQRSVGRSVSLRPQRLRARKRVWSPAALGGRGGAVTGEAGRGSANIWFIGEGSMRLVRKRAERAACFGLKSRNRQSKNLEVAPAVHKLSSQEREQKPFMNSDASVINSDAVWRRV